MLHLLCWGKAAQLTTHNVTSTASASRPAAARLALPDEVTNLRDGAQQQQPRSHRLDRASASFVLEEVEV